MIIVKIGGGKSINIDGIVQGLAKLDEKIIIVHGANAYRDELANNLNTPKKVIESVSGYSSVFSDEKAIDILIMAYAGLRNKRIVECCQKNGINAIGLSGIDGRIVQGARNRGIRVKEGTKLKIIRDFSGKPKSINRELLDLLMDKGYVPVLTVPIVDEEGFAINSENDDIVGLLQKEFSASRIIQLIEEKGFLDDKNDPDSVVKIISVSELEQRESQVQGRMKRKIHSLINLFNSAETQVIISDGRIENPIEYALNGGGTLIKWTKKSLFQLMLGVTSQ